MTEKFSQENPVDAPAESTTKIFTLPDISGLSFTYFVALRLEDYTAPQERKARTAGGALGSPAGRM